MGGRGRGKFAKIKNGGVTVESVIKLAIVIGMALTYYSMRSCGCEFAMGTKIQARKDSKYAAF
jgi:hypothetical protein